MPMRNPKPTSPGRRFVTYSDFAEITKSKPEKTLVEGIQLIREAMRQPGIKGSVLKERMPGAEYADDTTLLEEIKNRATTVYHPVGS